MKFVIILVLLLVIGAVVLINYTTKATNNDPSKKLKSDTYSEGDKKLNNISTITVRDIDGKELSLSTFNGKVLLIVNVASKCGYTPQYKDLQELYERYKEKGLEILGFPCNDFGWQEPGSNEEIKQFCSMNFGVTFKLFDKVKITGKDRDKLYAVLTDNDVTGTKNVKWNFEKFLISKNGDIVSRYTSSIKPMSEELVTAIESELKK